MLSSYCRYFAKLIDKWFLLLACFVFSVLASASAAQQAGREAGLNSQEGLGELSESHQVEGDLLLSSATMSWIETKRRALSGDIVALGEYIDGLMGDVESFADHNQSYVKLYLGIEESRFDDTEFLHRIRFSLDLPITKKRFRFILESENEETQESVHIEPPPTGTLIEDGQVDDGINATFRYLFEASNWNRLSFDWGVKARLEPDLFSRARGIRSWNLTDRLSLTFSPELFWYESRGAGVKASLNVDRWIKQKFMLRFRPSAVWYERGSKISYLPRVSFYHDISQLRAVEYSIGLTAKNLDNHTVISEYFGQIRYRRDLYKSWLFYQMSFGATFPRDFDYRTNPFVGFRLEILFSDDLERVLRTRLH